MNNTARKARRKRGDKTVQAIDNTPGAITCDGCGRFTSTVKYGRYTHKTGDLLRDKARQIDVCPECFRKLDKRGLVKYPDRKFNGKTEIKGRPFIPEDKIDLLKDRAQRIDHGRRMSKHIRGYRVDKKGNEVKAPARRLFPDMEKIQVFQHPEKKLADYRVKTSAEVYASRKAGTAPKAKAEKLQPAEKKTARKGYQEITEVKPGVLATLKSRIMSRGAGRGK